MPAEHADEQPGDLTREFLIPALSPETVRATTSQRYGQGFRLDVGGPKASYILRIFPETGYVQLSEDPVGSPQPRQWPEMKVASVVRQGRGVRFEAPNGLAREFILVYPDGLHLQATIPLDADPADFVPDVPDARAALPQHRYEQWPPQDPPPPAPAPAEPSLPQPSGSPERQPRVTIHGRVGAEPKFRTTTRRQQLVASFPLAEHTGASETVWHTVVLFGERARKLQEKGIIKGQEVEVVGYEHERQMQTKQGTTTVKEVYAAAVRTQFDKP